MKINCNIIRDLLPLYNDKITSKESNELIEEHLSQCEDCKNYYKEIKEDISNNLDLDEKNILKNFLKQIKKKRFIAIILTIIITIVIVLKSLDIFNKENLFIKDFNNELVTIEENEDSSLTAIINTIDYSKCNVILEQNIDNTIDVYISLSQSIKDKIKPNKEFKKVGILPKCKDNYIEENLKYNWLWEDGKGKIVLKSINDNIKILNIYYLETKEKYNAISKSRETVDPYFEMIKIWENKS